MKKLLFHLGHPAHFHLFYNAMNHFSIGGNEIFIIIKKKDVLEELLQQNNFKYQNILPNGKTNGRIGLVIDLLNRGSKLISFVIKNKPDILVGSTPDISYTGKLLGIPTLNLCEDDAAVVPLYANMAYPWATMILSPDSCDNGRWNYKTRKYNSYHELAYLHPDIFKPDIKVISKYIDSEIPYVILRFSSLKAYHDLGKSGVSDDMIINLIDHISPHARILITSERLLSPLLDPYVMRIEAKDMHHFLAFAQLLIGDSQTMSAEAAVLGTPFIRYNDFVGKIGYLNELENKYGLGFGFKLGEFDDVIKQSLKVLKEGKEHFTTQKNLMLKDKVRADTIIIKSIHELLSDNDIQ